MAFNEEEYIVFGDVSKETETKPEDDIMHLYNEQVEDEDEFYEEEETQMPEDL